ncbi:MAG TPA: hypothetical protein VHY84_03135 [Bryobacteraceae bacterium]|jgi:hypothetical protein|nr:hypothetical protein [Bryobacteraceae bacterium]
MRTPKVILALVCCFPIFGEQHISLRSSPEIYSATVDDSLSRTMSLRLVPVFSPLIDTSPPRSPYLTATDLVSDKIMLSPQLEDCQSGHPNCPPTIVNDAFMHNAETNIEKGRKQVRDLKQERLPESLEPVRRFLLDNLVTALRMEEARYEYIKSGMVAPLKALLDQYCTTDQQRLIRKLGEAPDAEKRRELSWADWHNAVLKCYEVPSRKYPMEAWKQFTRQYHVRESLTPEPE